jgi:hypothetical protein
MGSAVVGLALLGCWAAAQEGPMVQVAPPAPVMVQEAPPAPVMGVPAAVPQGGCATCGGGGLGAGDAGAGHKRPHPWLNRLGVCCWSHHFLPTCSSLRSEGQFIFGSCRAFFGEPCLPRPPMTPVPPGYVSFPYSAR